jgi:hypothetical protein
MIWTFADSENKATDDINLAQYKLTGKFYDDINGVCKLMGIQVHPALRPVLWEKQKLRQFNEEAEDGKEPEEKPISIIKFDKHRIDKNSLKALFHILPNSTVKTLKFCNNGISPSQFDSLLAHLASTPTIQTVFFDWNPLYKEDFRKLPAGDSPFYERPKEEPSRFAKFVGAESKIKILFLRGNQITDEDVTQICTGLKDNHTLKVLDVSYNKLTKASVEAFVELLEVNKSLEFIGLAKNGFSIDDLKPLLD